MNCFVLKGEMIVKMIIWSQTIILISMMSEMKNNFNFFKLKKIHWILKVEIHAIERQKSDPVNKKEQLYMVIQVK